MNQTSFQSNQVPVSHTPEIPAAAEVVSLRPAGAIGIIAVDGLAGAGKGTLAAALARHFDVPMLDTGSMYRTFALAVRHSLIIDGCEDRAAEAAGGTNLLLSYCAAVLPGFEARFEYQWSGTAPQVFLDGADVSAEIRREEVAKYASRVAQVPDVRAELVRIQRAIALENPRGCVVDGRDVGSRVFPDASVKILLTAPSMLRAERRHDDLGETAGSRIDTWHAILSRDTADMVLFEPLLTDPAVINLDSGGLSAEESLDRALREIAARR